jgi:hypothetical protein
VGKGRGLGLTTCGSRKSSDREVKLPVAERRMRGMEAILSGERERERERERDELDWLWV